ncbi:MAG: hypothetical protein ACKVOI_10145 [Dongiaceae bacterium]
MAGAQEFGLRIGCSDRSVDNQAIKHFDALIATGLMFGKALAYFFSASPFGTKKRPSRGDGRGARVGAGISAWETDGR